MKRRRNEFGNGSEWVANMDAAMTGLAFSRREFTYTTVAEGPDDCDAAAHRVAADIFGERYRMELLETIVDLDESNAPTRFRATYCATPALA